MNPMLRPLVWLRNGLYYVIYHALSSLADKNSAVFIHAPSSDSYQNLDLIEKACEGMNISVVQKGSFSLGAIFKLATAKAVCLDQTSYITSHLNLHPDTMVIQFWHAGGAFKCFGHDGYRPNADRELEQKRNRRIHGQYDYVICSSQSVREIYAGAFEVDKERVLALGTARTDLLFETGPAEARQAVASELKLNPDRIWILYAPTIRTAEDGTRSSPPVPRCLLDLQASGDCEILVRNHPSIKDAPVPPECKNAGAIAQHTLLAGVDMLVTDFASIIFDFAYYDKPMIFYCEDEERYYKEERDIYFKLPVYFGSNISRSEQELLTLLKKNSKMNQVSTKKLWQQFMGACDGSSAKKCAGFIRDMLENGKG